jgi:hypothetical protein
MKLAFKISLLSDNSGFCFFTAAHAGLVTLVGAVAGTFALAVFAIIFAIAFIAITFAVTAAGEAVQHLASPCNDTVTVGGNNVNDTGDGGQSQNDLGNYLQNFHSKPSRFFMVSITSITNPGGKCNNYF